MKYLKNAQLVIKKVKTNNNRIIYLGSWGPSLLAAILVYEKYLELPLSDEEFNQIINNYEYR